MFRSDRRRAFSGSIKCKTWEPYRRVDPSDQSRSSRGVSPLFVTENKIYTFFSQIQKKFPVPLFVNETTFVNQGGLWTGVVQTQVPFLLSITPVPILEPEFDWALTQDGERPTHCEMERLGVDGTYDLSVVFRKEYFNNVSNLLYLIQFTTLSYTVTSQGSCHR